MLLLLRLVISAVLAAPLIFFSSIALAASVKGRVKLEPSQRWTLAQQQPFKFSKYVLVYLSMGVFYVAILSKTGIFSVIWK